MFEWQKETRDGMLQMVANNRGYIEASHKVLRHIHNIYIEKNSNLYSSKELVWIDHFLDSLIYKEFLVRIAIEQLQSVRHGKINESLWAAIENSISTLNCSEDEEILVSFALESFLFETRSFLDVFFIFVCLLLKTGFDKGFMGKSKFYDELDKVVGSPFNDKAIWLKKYFDTNVFGHEEDQNASIFRKDWGTLLISLRDKIAHRDAINISLDSKEKFIDDILLEWPTTKGITYHLLAETIGNGVHALFHQALCHIYGLDWDNYQRIAQ